MEGQGKGATDRIRPKRDGDTEAGATHPNETEDSVSGRDYSYGRAYQAASLSFSGAGISTAIKLTVLPSSSACCWRM